MLVVSHLSPCLSSCLSCLFVLDIRSCRGLSVPCVYICIQELVAIYVHVYMHILALSIVVQAVCVLCNIALLLCNVWLSI